MHKLCQAIVTSNHLLALLRENYSQHFNGHYIFICAHSIINELFSVGISEKIAIPWHVYILWAPLSHLFLFFPHSPIPSHCLSFYRGFQTPCNFKNQNQKCNSWLIGMPKQWLSRNYRCEQLCEWRFTVHSSWFWHWLSKEPLYLIPSSLPLLTDVYAREMQQIHK